LCFSIASKCHASLMASSSTYFPPRGLFSSRGPQGRYENSSRSLEHAARVRCSAWKAPESTTWNHPACARTTRTNTCRKIGMTDRHLKRMPSFRIQPLLEDEEIKTFLLITGKWNDLAEIPLSYYGLEALHTLKRTQQICWLQSL